MTELRVWAPFAHAVELVLDPGPDLRPPRAGAQRLSLEKEEAEQYGWWRAPVQVTPGTDYTYAVDGGKLLPDPRSLWQPFGAHGPSRTVDFLDFAWSDQRWRPPSLSSAIFYELHIGTFTPEGTFDSAIERLTHLVQLGITHVELMPVAEFSGDRGWGYDGVDLFAPHHAYGGPKGLNRFVDACHSSGLAVVLDVVYNHLGPSGNYLDDFGPYFTDHYRTPWGKAVNLDGPGSAEVRRFFCDNAKMWLRDYHFDALRLDAIHAVYDSSAIHFLEQLASEIKDLKGQIGRHFDLIAENDLNDPRVVSPPAIGGYGIDAQWNDDFHHALHTVLTGECRGYYSDFGKLADLAKALTHVYVYDGRQSPYRRRIQGRPVHDLSVHCFVGFLQNHDQVGNRAKGDRASHLMSLRQLKIGAALVLCGPFLPMLFQGEEFGASSPFLYFTDHHEPELASAVSEGRRTTFESFGWIPEEIPDPQDRSTFESSKLNWSEIHREPHEDLLGWYRSLILLRRNTPALQDGRLDRLDAEFSESDSWLILYRQSVAIVCNFSGLRQSIPLRFSGRPLLASDPHFALHSNAADVPGEGVLILDRESCR